MNTAQQLRESILTELIKSFISSQYPRLEELSVEELENLERAARITKSIYWMEIDRTLEKQL